MVFPPFSKNPYSILQKLHTLLFPLVEGGTVDESHVFYKKVPPGFLGSKKPKSAERVCVCDGFTVLHIMKS